MLHPTFRQSRALEKHQMGCPAIVNSPWRYGGAGLKRCVTGEEYSRDNVRMSRIKIISSMRDERESIQASFRADGHSGRRKFTATLLGCLLVGSLPSRNEAVGGGAPDVMNKYIKRKRLDPLDTYVPSILLAQLQFQEVDAKLAGEKPGYADARTLLRSGPASSLRTDIRAVAQYAWEAGDDSIARNAVDQCLSALEELDSLLFRATRSESASIDTMKMSLSSAVSALDRLLTTVPAPILEKGKAIALAYRDFSLSETSEHGNPQEPM